LTEVAGSAGRDGPLVIVGGGLAGWTVARELRQKAPGRDIHLVCADRGDFYPKPMLSNAFARGLQAMQIVQKAAADQAAEVGVKLHAGVRVEGIDRAAGVLHTATGPIPYGQLVLALGADPIRPPTPGIEHALSVNDIDDYARFRERLAAAGPGARVLAIGGGLIGCEFANDLATGGYSVSVLDPAAWPIATLLPQEQGAALQGALEALGVRFHFGDLATSIEALPGGAYRAQLRSGGQIEADVVLSAIGLAPRTALAQAAGLETGRGILVDEWGTTSDPRIFALGDCAAYRTAARPDIAGGAPRALPFVLPIMTAARAIAPTLAGTPTPIRFGAMAVRVKTPAHPLSVQA
jgi:rubredoxin-NAD+ reductase